MDERYNAFVHQIARRIDLLDWLRKLRRKYRVSLRQVLRNQNDTKRLRSALRDTYWAHPLAYAVHVNLDTSARLYLLQILRDPDEVAALRSSLVKGTLY